MLKLEPTAALVMQWALGLYNEGPALKYIQRLDLSSGFNLMNKCDSVCDWYGEVILNRKNFIKHLIEQELAARKEEFQLVFLAAGKSPLPVEILLENTTKIFRIFEIDLSGMEDKKRLYIELFPESVDKLHCITADITSPDIINLLDMQANGYSRNIPSIIIVEGISYYLRKNELQNIMSGFRSYRKNTFIIEYMVPNTYIDRKRQFIPREVFRIIQEYCGLKAVTTYTKEELRKFFLKNGGDLLAAYSMTDMELKRTGTNLYFEKPYDGWIECAIGTIDTIPA